VLDNLNHRPWQIWDIRESTHAHRIYPRDAANSIEPDSREDFSTVTSLGRQSFAGGIHAYAQVLPEMSLGRKQRTKLWIESNPRIAQAQQQQQSIFKKYIYVISGLEIG
jgi:hypothetical protein